MKKTSLGELIANAVSHGVGVLFAITALVLLIVKASSLSEILSSIAFGVALVMLYLSSTLYHSFPEKMKTVSKVFQRFDHSSIFILIAGTYTPMLVLLVGTREAYILLIFLWVLTVFGIVMKSIWIDKFQAVHLVIYLFMGWSVLFIGKDVLAGLGYEIIFVLIGGIFYTVGVAFYVSRFKYSHFIWHIFVLFGSIFHFVCVYGYIL